MKRTLREMGHLFCLYTVWCLATEAVFTGVADVVRDYWNGVPFNSDLPCRTSLWSIPVYGISAAIAFGLIGALYPRFFQWSWWNRGLVYVFGTYCFEYGWGATLEFATGRCPWTYRDSSFAVLRYIKPEYFALWFVFGFSLEWIKVKVLPRITSG